jgi:hypothetical protein
MLSVYLPKWLFGSERGVGVPDVAPVAVNEVVVELGCDWHTINDTVLAYGEPLVDDPAEAPLIDHRSPGQHVDDAYRLPQMFNRGEW